MIYQLWLTFFCSSLALLVFGYYMKNDLLRILAVLLLFMSGMALDPIGGGIDLNTGAVANYSLIDNVTSHATQIDTYTNYGYHTYGFYMMMVAIGTLVFIFFERRTPNTRD